MNRNQCFELGYIERTLGFDGSVVAFFDVDDAGRYAKVDGFFLEINGQLVPYLVDEIKSHGKDKFAIRFQNIGDHDSAQKLKGTKLYLPEKFLPPLKKGQYYFHELIDCQVEDEVLGPLGKINGIVDLPHQTLATMEFMGQEVLIPVHDDILIGFNREGKKVSTRLPDGLLEVYTKPENQTEPA
jgi:16S rRNA processing protein RimM